MTEVLLKCLQIIKHNGLNIKMVRKLKTTNYHVLPSVDYNLKCSLEEHMFVGRN